MVDFPPDTGVRVTWDAVPKSVRAAIEDALGALVKEAVTQPRGFSPGVAVRTHLRDGRTVFIKAIDGSAQPIGADMHRREARIAGALPTEVNAPRLLWHGEPDGWVVLAFDAIDGHNPALPWANDDLTRVLGAMTDLAAALTPWPLGAVEAVETVAERLSAIFTGWANVAPEGLGTLAIQKLPELKSLERDSLPATAGESLLHLDVRADNILLADRVYFVDWPHAAIGASWIDLAAMLPSVAMQGGGDPDRLWSNHPLSGGTDTDQVDAFLAGLAGFFIFHSLLPVDAALPTLRPFQHAQGVATLAWLASRRGWS